MTGGGRRWLELRVRCPSAGDRSDLLADGLLLLGARGVEERGGWYVSYFDEPDDPEFIVRMHARAERFVFDAESYEHIDTEKKKAVARWKEEWREDFE